MSVGVDQKVEDFELTDNKGEKRSLAEALKGGPVVLAFFPLAFTGVCSAEMCEFRDSLKSFEALKSTVFGISVDSRFSLDAFSKEQNLNFPLLSDFNKEVSQSFDVLYEEFLGMKGVSKRSVFVIRPDFTVAYRWVTDNAGERPDLSEVTKVLS